MKTNNPNKPHNEFHHFLQTYIGIFVDYKAKYPSMPDWQRQEIEAFQSLISGQNAPDILRKTRVKIAFYHSLYGLFYALTGASYKREVIDPLSQLLSRHSEKSLFEAVRKVNDAYEDLTQDLVTQNKTVTHEKTTLQHELEDVKSDLQHTKDELIPMKADLDFLISLHKQAQTEKEAKKSLSQKISTDEKTATKKAITSKMSGNGLPVIFQVNEADSNESAFESIRVLNQ